MEPLLDSHAAAAFAWRSSQNAATDGSEGRDRRAVHVGKLWRFRPSAIDQWIERQLAGFFKHFPFFNSLFFYS